MDLPDLAGPDVDGEQQVLPSEPEQRRRLAVDLDPLCHLDSEVATQPVVERNDPVGPHEGTAGGPHLAAAIAVGHGVCSEDVPHLVKVTGLEGAEEPLEQGLVGRVVRLEAPVVVVEVGSGPV